MRPLWRACCSQVVATATERGACILNVPHPDPGDERSSRVCSQRAHELLRGRKRTGSALLNCLPECSLRWMMEQCSRKRASLNLHVPKGTLQGDWQKQCLLLYYIFSIPKSMNLVITETIGALALLPTVCRWPPAGPPVESDPATWLLRFRG